MALVKKEYEINPSTVERLNKQHEISATPYNFTPIHYKVRLKELSDDKAKGKGRYKLDISHFERPFDSDDFSKPKWEKDLTLYYKSKVEALQHYERFTDYLGQKKCTLPDIMRDEFSLYVASEDMEFEGVSLKANDVVIKTEEDEAILIARMDSIDFSNRAEGTGVMRPNLKGYIKAYRADGTFDKWAEVPLNHEKYPTRYFMLEVEDMYQKLLARQVASRIEKDKDTDYLLHGFAQYIKRIEGRDHQAVTVDSYMEIKNMPGVYNHQEKTFIDDNYLLRVVQKNPVAITWEEFRKKNNAAYKKLIELARETGKNPDEMPFPIRLSAVPPRIMESMERNRKLHSKGRDNTQKNEDMSVSHEKCKGVHRGQTNAGKER